MPLRCFSYGGGVQSTAALVLAAEGAIDFPVFLFANVGDDSEHPDTLRYVREVAMPYAAAQGIDLIELAKSGRTLYATLTQTTRDLIPWAFPAMRRKDPRRRGEALRLSRTCTSDWKIAIIAAEQKRRGATASDPAMTGLGISLDELERMHTESGIAWQHLVYPLIDRRLTRQDCENIIQRASLPIPPKSACWFCPFQSPGRWQALAHNRPDLYDRAVTLEADKRGARLARGKDPVYFSRQLQPLASVTGNQVEMEFDDTCESGFCMV